MKYKYEKSLVLHIYTREGIQRTCAILLDYMFKVMKENEDELVDFEIKSTKDSIRIRFAENKTFK